MSSSDTEISFRVEDVLDHDPEINPATDYLIECKRCGEIRHKSWFQVNWPACAHCMKFESLFLDNLTDELVMADIRRAEREVSEAKADMKIAAATATAIETTRYRMSLERVEAAFPALNPDHDDFDAELLGDVADLKITYESKGMTPTDALQKAVKKLVPTETAKQADATTVKPKVDAADAAAAAPAAAPADAAAARVVGHQHEVAAGQGHESGQRRTLVAALFLLDLDQQFLAVGDDVLDLRVAHAGAFAEVVLGDFLERQEAVAVFAVVDEAGFQRGLDAGDHALVDIALLLLLADGLDIKVNELLPIHDGNAQLFSLRCVE